MEFKVVFNKDFWDLVTILVCGYILLYIPLSYKIGRTSRKVTREFFQLGKFLRDLQKNINKTNIKVDRIDTSLSRLLGVKETPDNNDDNDKEE